MTERSRYAHFLKEKVGLTGAALVDSLIYRLGLECAGRLAADGTAQLTLKTEDVAVKAPSKGKGAATPPAA